MMAPPSNGSRNGETMPQYNPMPGRQQSVDDIHSNHHNSSALQQQQHQQQQQQQIQQIPVRNTSGVSFAQQMPTTRTLTPTRAVPQQLVGVAVNNSMNATERRPPQQQQQQQQHLAQPLFQRFMTDDVQEIKTYTRLIENQGRKLAELETIHNDLEQRLQVESNARQRLEKTLEERERKYEAMIQELENDRDQWKKLVEEERTKNSRLMDQVNKKEQDILQMVQRKFNHPQRDGVNHPIRNVRSSDKSSTSHSRSPPEHRLAQDQHQQQQQHHRSPQEILEDSGSMETARAKNATNLLFDFFGL